MPDSTSIEHFMKTAMLSYGPQIEGGKIQVSVTQQNMPDCCLYTDWDILKQIFYTSIRNALKLL